jgi:hypothetical protein
MGKGQVVHLLSGPARESSLGGADRVPDAPAVELRAA